MAEETVNKGNSSALARDYLDSLLVELRTIDSVEASTKMELYGASFSTPVMGAALSGWESMRPGGAVEMARAIFEAGAVMWTGIGGEEELEAMIATGAKTIKIIKPYADKDLIFKKIAHAEKAGALAVGMDTDYVFGRMQKRGFAMEFPVSPKTLSEIKEFVRATKLPFILKGILSEQDAEKAVEAGAGGIVVSHHRGIVDYAVPPLKILPRIVKIVNGKFPIFVDCSIARGMDAFKAIALGAAAVSVGGPLMRALSKDGGEGVKKAIDDITSELSWVMNLTGSPDIKHIDPKVLWSA
jgi:isopentenyl diphosphate isomerase/L-lactate dehydrogenase-like FMN-dependent dehydrogenase